jgi:multimeric flavodoxin WrbA
MKRIVAINGSPREQGNTRYLMQAFLSGAAENHAVTDVYDAHRMNLNYCNGCLRCNLIKRCSVVNDDWTSLSQKILCSDVLVFASPVYFHHVTAPVKKILDRFRSFVNVRITEQGLEHQPWQEWNKDFVLLLSMGSSNDEDAKPVIDLFGYMVGMLGVNNRLHVITGNRLAVIKQVGFTKEELEKLYIKLNLSGELAAHDSLVNRELLNNCFALGKSITRESD